MIQRFLVLSAGLILATPLCRFTVRDVGFVDLGDPGYQYYALVSERATALESACREAAKTAFADTNVEFEVIDPSLAADHPAGRYARELKIEKFPTTILVRPDGEAVELPIDADFGAAGAAVFESVASSKLRRRLTELVLSHYCVVLLVAGEDAAKNREAERAVEAAFGSIEKVFDKMPKAVGALPISIVLPVAEQAGERLLLWSLEIGSGGARPVVTVLTGRGRRFGPLLEGDDIGEDAVLDILSKAGESCECGLDRSWMRGLRVPLRWDAATRQQAVEELGFDPENPLVKAEISSIMAKGSNGQLSKDGGEPTVADLLLGYSEVGIDEGVPLAEEADESDESDESTAGQDGESSEGGSLWAIWATLAGFVVLNLGIAGFVLLRARRR